MQSSVPVQSLSTKFASLSVYVEHDNEGVPLDTVTSHIVIEPSLSALPSSGAEPSLMHATLLPCDAMPSGLLPASAQPRKASVEAS